MFGAAFERRRVLVTGHTGFKGSWLALWLDRLGARVTGISLPPESSPSHWQLLDMPADSRHIDIRDADALRDAVANARPEIVFHLAAQSLVRRSYRQPLDTWATNVLGTANLLDACRGLPGLRAIVVVTTDKCYENREWPWGYREIDPLGGHDPYSASKAGAELVASSFRSSFFASPEGALVATARAGNVIGGGDWSEDRLVPDLARAMAEGRELEIRSPRSTRPWQHVLDCLAGYLMLAQRLSQGDARFAEAWNFGPDREGNRTVEEVLTAMRDRWNRVSWRQVQAKQPHEAQLLQLDSSKARARLGWRPVLGFEESVAVTAGWYRAWLEDRQVVSRDQLDHYTALARERGLEWAAGDAR